MVQLRSSAVALAVLMNHAQYGTPTATSHERFFMLAMSHPIAVTALRRSGCRRADSLTKVLYQPCRWRAASTPWRKWFDGLGGEWSAGVGPLEGLGHRVVEVVNEREDAGAEVVGRTEVPAAQVACRRSRRARVVTLDEPHEPGP